MRQPAQGGADGTIQGEFKQRQDVGIEPLVVEFVLIERDQAAPLVAQAEHVGDQGFAVSEVAVAMQKQVVQGRGRFEVCPSIVCQVGARCGAQPRDARGLRQWRE